VKVWTTFSLFLGLVTCALAQGPLTPSGAPDATMRTLQQIEPRVPLETLPFTISQPGSYYFTKNLDFGSQGGSAITIMASNVTLDLGGFALTNCGATAISVDSGIPDTPVRNVTIRNGTIANIGVDGIVATSALSLQVEDMRVHSFGGKGIQGGDNASLQRNIIFYGGGAIVTGKSSVVKDCVMYGHQPGSSGTVTTCLAGSGSLVENCTVRGSSVAFDLDGCQARDLTVEYCAIGLEMDTGSVENARFDNCGTYAVRATGATLRGVRVSTSAGAALDLKRSRVSDSVAVNCEAGFKLEDSLATGCQALDNRGAGFEALGSGTVQGNPVSTASTLSQCAATNNVTGFNLTNARAVDCQAVRNTSAGFLVVTSYLSGCTATYNFNTGFSGQRSHLSGCVAVHNAIHGYDLDNSTLEDCQAENNTQIGFDLTGARAERLTSTGSGQTGIACGDGTTLSGSQVRGSGNSGITTGSRCQIRDNTVASSGAGSATEYADIFIGGDYNRVEGNHVTGPGTADDFGIQIRGSSVEVPTAASHNVVIGNTAGGHTGRNYNFPPGGNFIGTILNTASPADSSAAHANFEL
jgi:hypothetical protein